MYIFYGYIRCSSCIAFSDTAAVVGRSECRGVGLNDPRHAVSLQKHRQELGRCLGTGGLFKGLDGTKGFVGLRSCHLALGLVLGLEAIQRSVLVLARLNGNDARLLDVLEFSAGVPFFRIGGFESSSLLGSRSFQLVFAFLNDLCRESNNTSLSGSFSRFERRFCQTRFFNVLWFARSDSSANTEWSFLGRDRRGCNVRGLRDAADGFGAVSTNQREIAEL